MEKKDQKDSEIPYGKIIGALLGAGGLGALGYKTAVKDSKRGLSLNEKEKWRDKFNERLFDIARTTGRKPDEDTAWRLAAQLKKEAEEDAKTGHQTAAIIGGLLGGWTGSSIGGSMEEDPIWTTGILSGMAGGGYLSNKAIKGFKSSKKKSMGNPIVDDDQGPGIERIRSALYALPGVGVGAVAGGQLGRYLSPFDNSGNPKE